jgi:hypothetical protein
MTTDFGKTFKSIVANLPTGGPDFLHVVREDPVNRDLLYVGTDVGAYLSRDRGMSWQKFMTGLPTVPVHDLKIHPRDHDLIAATHGRGIWIADVSVLQHLGDSAMAKDAFLFAPRTAYAFGEAPEAEISQGQGTWSGRNAPFGAEISYRLSSGTAKDTVKIVITNMKGDTLTTLNGRGGAGLHRITWDLQGKPPKAKPLSPAGRRDSLKTVAKINHVFDSLAAAGTGTKAELALVRERVDKGTVFELLQGAGGGGGGGAGRANERAGEGPMPRGVAGGGRRGADTTKKAGPADTTKAAGPADTTKAVGAAGGPGGGGATEGAVSEEVVREVLGALRAAKALPGGGFGGGRRGGFVETGDYLVTMTWNGTAQHQVLRVENVSGVTAAAGNDDEDPFDP